MKATFSAAKINKEAYYLVDENGEKSITNEAEELVKYLHDYGSLKNKKLIYKDSSGRWDEILHDGKGNFLGFNLIEDQNRSDLPIC